MCYVANTGLLYAPGLHLYVECYSGNTENQPFQIFDWFLCACSCFSIVGQITLSYAFTDDYFWSSA